MAGSQKEFELLFKLQASLGGNFNGVFKSAIDTQNKLSNSMKTVNSIQSKVDGYTKASDAISKNKAKLTQLNAKGTERNRRKEKSVTTCYADRRNAREY